MSDGKLRALDELKAALAECQSVLSNLINPPEVVSGAAIITGYATVVQAEHRARKALTAAASHLSASSNEGWRTMDSAPGDEETPVLLWIGGQASVGLTWRRFSGEVVGKAGMCGNQLATHWRPLPPPPSPGEEQSTQSMEQGR